MKKATRKGFTIVELLVVLAVGAGSGREVC